MQRDDLITIDRLAEIAYTCYRNHTKGKSLASGQLIPLWNDLKPEIQEAWKVAAAGIGVILAYKTICIPIDQEPVEMSDDCWDLIPEATLS